MSNAFEIPQSGMTPKQILPQLKRNGIIVTDTEQLLKKSKYIKLNL